MTIEYADNTMHVKCDHCGRKPETYFGEWKEAWAEAKADGWQAYKDETDAWCHKCLECVEAR